MMTVLGMPATEYSLLTSLLVSNSIGKLTGVAASHLVARLESGSTFTPIMVKPMGLYLACSFSRMGISVRQGPHQLAQKLIMITWPLYWSRLTGLPAMLSSLNTGAGVGPASAGTATIAAHSRARRALDVLFMINRLPNQK